MQNQTNSGERDSHAEILAKLEKIKRLAERGVDGEADNANELFERLCAKYDIDLSELQDSKRYEFRFQSKIHEEFLIQIIAKVLNLSRFSSRRIYSTGLDRRIIGLAMEMTEAQAARIEFLCTVLWRQWKAELTLLKKAFIAKHNLFPACGETRQLSLDELEEYDRMIMMMEGLKDLETDKVLKDRNRA
jgi:hypothetical protein